jgi:ABC-type dipeptide/oligopeptide/nickel transport system permease component
MGLLTFVMKRLLWMVPTLFGVSLIMFCLTVLTDFRESSLSYPEFRWAMPSIVGSSPRRRSTWS